MVGIAEDSNVTKLRKTCRPERSVTESKDLRISLLALVNQVRRSFGALRLLRMTWRSGMDMAKGGSLTLPYGYDF